MSTVDRYWAQTTAQNHSDDVYIAWAGLSYPPSLSIQRLNVWNINSSTQQPLHIPNIV